MEVDEDNENGGIKIIKADGASATLDAGAIQIQGGSDISGELTVVIDWKDKSFNEGVKGGSLNMKFNKSGSEFTLTGMELRGITIDGQMISPDLKVSTSYGYKVIAPIGLAFACDSPGLFEAKENTEIIQGITFPNMKLQVFFEEMKLRKFGPLWYCGELMPIGLWVGLIVTLFFTLVCYWGFSMLASIQTMDRFDDPKGKQIYVPQTD